MSPSNCCGLAAIMTQLSLPEFVQTHATPGGVTGHCTTAICQCTTKEPSEGGMCVRLFSENLPLTPSGKIRKTPASRLTEQVTVGRKKIPEEADPESEVLETFYPTHCTYICIYAQGCTRVVRNFFKSMCK